MKAAEARAKSKRKATAIAQERAALAIIRRKAKKAAVIKARLKFTQEFGNDIDSRIKDSVAAGGRKCVVCLGSEQHSFVEAQKQFDEHPYLSGIKRKMAQLRKDGYVVSQEVDTSEYTTMHESSVPDYTYYRYHATLTIKW
jgi:hypothetical protein